LTIYPRLNRFEQGDPRLVKALKKDILVRPKKNAKLEIDGFSQDFSGQFGQPIEVDKILK
jgi:hypothetical protein